MGEARNDGGRDGYASAWAILWNGAFWDMDMDVFLLEHLVRDAIFLSIGPDIVKSD